MNIHSYRALLKSESYADKQQRRLIRRAGRHGVQWGWISHDAGRTTVAFYQNVDPFGLTRLIEITPDGEYRQRIYKENMTRDGYICDPHWRAAYHRWFFDGLKWAAEDRCAGHLKAARKWLAMASNDRGLTS